MDGELPLRNPGPAPSARRGDGSRYPGEAIHEAIKRTSTLRGPRKSDLRSADCGPLAIQPRSDDRSPRAAAALPAQSFRLLALGVHPSRSWDQMLRMMQRSRRSDGRRGRNRGGRLSPSSYSLPACTSRGRARNPRRRGSQADGCTPHHLGGESQDQGSSPMICSMPASSSSPKADSPRTLPPPRFCRRS